ncbi:MAG: hypothetical protein WC979_08455 [Candidatus Pacearchaeota archaeon]|jgi:hypothetical protein
MKIVKISDMKTKYFFRVTFKKLILDLVVSGLIVFLMFFRVPLYQDIFLRQNFLRQFFDIVVNFIVYMLIFYTPCCYLVLLFFKGERK